MVVSCPQLDEEIEKLKEELVLQCDQAKVQ